jgi:hypothetical protein
MPYTVRKLPNKDLYRIRNSITGEIKCHACTKDHAEKQLRLLNYINHTSAKK